MNIQPNYFIPWRQELNARIASPLPLEGKLVELAKRISMIAIYPFLSFLALLEKGYSLFLGSEIRCEPVPVEEPVYGMNAIPRDEPAAEVKTCQDLLNFLQHERMTPEAKATRAAWQAVLLPLNTMFSDEFKQAFELNGIIQPIFLECHLKNKQIELSCLLPRSPAEKVGMKFVDCANGQIIDEKKYPNHASFLVSIPIEMNFEMGGEQFAKYCKNKIVETVNYVTKINCFVTDSIVKDEELDNWMPSRELIFRKLIFDTIFVTLGEASYFTLSPLLEVAELKRPLESSMKQVITNLEEQDISSVRLELLENLKINFRTAYDQRVQADHDFIQNGYSNYFSSNRTFGNVDLEKNEWTRLEELTGVPNLLQLFRIKDKIGMQALLTRKVEKRAWLRHHPDKNNGANGDQFEELQRLFKSAKDWMNA
ncbi:MAG: hypothetical protein H0V82_09690 [Candidatus Protochlamydia sp.]|nr:hypothetical protein [Candidatus Protochlamydia sp.]